MKPTILDFLLHWSLGLGISVILIAAYGLVGGDVTRAGGLGFLIGLMSGAGGVAAGIVLVWVVTRRDK